MKTLVLAVTISGALLASFALAASWITLVEAAGAVAVTLLVVLAVSRLRESR
ncbi:hypothetical protein [Arthrobacter sp. CAN_A1]|uniref:hypothetical protein n=1 Tax=Arthrobacter sp. CAN_A1 TaxID=2787717 RepID=UPI0018CB8C7E